MSFLNKLFVRTPDLKNLSTGEIGEEWVSYLYQKEGYQILDRNFSAFGKKQLGELDIVCKKGKTLVAVEVKTRKKESFMLIEEAVNQKKQGLLKRMIKVFVQQHPGYESFDLQVDVAAVLLSPVDNSVKSVRILRNVIEDE